MKILVLLLGLTFGMPSAAQPQPQPRPQSEYMVLTALSNLPAYFKYLFRQYKMDDETVKRMRALESVARAYAREPSKYVLFRDAGDSIFDLKPGEPSRMAVTGLELETPVYFNRGLTGGNFSYQDALTLWMHELGHKIKTAFPARTQDQIDTEARKLGGLFGGLAKVYDIKGSRLFVINPVANEGDYLDPAFFSFAELKDGMAIDRSQELNLALDASLPGHLRYTEGQRRVLDLYDAGGGNLGLAMRTGRLVKDMTKMYLESEEGGGHFTRAIVAWPSLQIRSYAPEDRPPEIIPDGSMRLVEGSLQISENAIAGRFQFEFLNQLNFHASPFPWDSTEIIALVDGRPLRLPIRLRYGMDNADDEDAAVAWMPGEAFGKIQTYGAYFSIEAAGLKGRKVVLQSMISRFFRFRGYDPIQDQIRQIRLDPAVEIDWSTAAGCDPALTGGRYGFSIAKLIADGI